MSFTHFRSFFFLILASFFFTWFGLVVFPWVTLGHLPPIQGDDGTDITPWDMPGAAHQGELVYASNGCAYCHTQQVRAATSGADIIRGWGTATDDTDPKKEITRRTYPRDYIWDHQVFLGNNRSGADLSNVAHRFPTAAQLYTYLYDPYILNPHSSMPAYRFLFTTRRITGVSSDDAVVLSAADAPGPDGKWCPRRKPNRSSPISSRLIKATISRMMRLAVPTFLPPRVKP